MTAGASSVELGIAMDLGTDGSLRTRYEETAALLGPAADAGFTSVWAGENRPSGPGYFHLPSPLLALSMLAPTTDLALGTGVLLASSWQPLSLAYDAAVLDQLSGGRLRLGIAGGNPANWARFGVPREQLGTRFDETLQALKALWSGADGFHGETIDIDAGIRPLPLQAGGPPLLVGGLAPRAIRRAAKFGDGWFGATNHRFDSQIRPAVTACRAASPVGRSRPFVVAVTRITVVAGTDEEAWRDGGPYVDALLRTYAGFGGLRHADGRVADPGEPGLVAEFAPELALVGSPATVRGQIERYRDAGVTQIQARVRPADLPLPLVRRTIDLLGSVRD